MNLYETVKSTLFNYLRDYIRYGLSPEEIGRMLDELKEMICGKESR